MLDRRQHELDHAGDLAQKFCRERGCTLGSDRGDHDVAIYVHLLEDVISAMVPATDGCVSVFMDDGRYGPETLALVRPKKPETLPVRITRNRIYVLPTGFGLFLCALLAVIGTQAFEPASRFQFWFTVLTVVLVVAGYFLTRQRTTAAAQEAEAKMGETRNGVPGRN